MNGQPALWSTSFLIDGTAASSNNAASAFLGQGRVHWEFQFYPSSGASYFQGIYDETAFDNDTTFITSSVNGSSASPYGLFSVLIPFTLGNPFAVNQSFRAFAYGVGSAEGVRSGGSYSLDRSVYWGGLGTITTASGLDITQQVVLSSANNFAWQRSFVPVSSIPEPPSIALLLVGFALLPTISRIRAAARHAMDRSPQAARRAPRL
jgi:hypothetical protein